MTTAAMVDLASAWGLGGVLNALDHAGKATGDLPAEAFELGMALRRFLEAFPPVDRSAAYRELPCRDELPARLGPAESSDVAHELVREAVGAKVAAELGMPHMASASAHRVAGLAHRLVDVLADARLVSFAEAEGDEPVGVLLERLRSRRLTREASA